MNYTSFKKKYERKNVEVYTNNINKEKPLVSVCIVTYNQASYIKQCLENILSQQTNFDFEILLGEDASTDGTREICIEYAKKHPNKIRLFLHHRENNISIGGSPTGRFNFLYNLYSAKSKYIAFCEGDDYWTDPYKLQKQVDFLEANQDYVLCFHKVKILQTDGSLVDDFITKVPENYETQETLARLGNYIHTPSVVFRNILTTFPDEMKLSPIGDYFLYMLLTNYGKVKRLNETMGVYRHGVGVHSSQSTFELTKRGLITYMLIASCMTKKEIKFILLDRVIKGIGGVENVFRSEFKKEFLSNYSLYRIIKLILTPKKFIEKLIIKLK